MRRKVYGKTEAQTCPFCAKLATRENEQGLPVCIDHVEHRMDEGKCICGEFLELRKGKFGPYFHCHRCGNLSYNKGMKFRAPPTAVHIAPEQKKMPRRDPPREITITTDDLEYF